MTSSDTGHSSDGHNQHGETAEADFSPTQSGVVAASGHGTQPQGVRAHTTHSSRLGHDSHLSPVGDGHQASHESGHGAHLDHVGEFRRLFWVMLVIGLPVVAFSDMFAMILGYRLPDFWLLGWVSPVLGTVMYVWGGKPFLTGAVSEIRAKSPGMMLLVALAISVAFVSSWGASLSLLSHQLDFWWELSLLIVIMLLGHWIEMRSLAQSSSALESLAALLPDEAEKVVGDQFVTVAPAELEVGDVVIVRPGGRVPADGQVTDGSADVDESMITGESRPVS
ncbi:MAG: heavy metal translocating P-type ATPase, partial [Propionibacteriaceae bacterium]|nr:heavy metal translocating P-type ATPase [Propionibacteriaceae bacterium]